METILEAISDNLDSVIWSSTFVVLLFGAAIYFSISTRFMQIRHFKEMFRLLKNSGESDEKRVTSFEALSIALSARVGTGNIAGVATAIALGGPGAIFWMWLLGFLSAATAFVESTLAQIYKEDIDGEYRGGPAYFIYKGLGIKSYGVIFAICASIGLGLLLPGIHSNTIAASMNNAFSIPPYITGLTIVVALSLIVFGGTKRIAKVAQTLVPIMGLLYVAVILIIVILKADQIPAVFSLIFKSAFGMEEAFAGILGAAVSWGVKRGLYSNEAGQGTGAHAAAAADVSHPAKQGIVQSLSVYIDTLICTATAFVILITGMYNVENSSSGFIVKNLPSNIDIGPEYVQYAIDSVLGGFGPGFVAISLLLFSFTTLIAYFHYVETNLIFLSSNIVRKWLVSGLKVVLPLAAFLGSISSATTVWGMGDLAVGVFAWLNVIAILLLSGIAIKALKDYEVQKYQGIDPVFSPSKLGIKNANAWENQKHEKNDINTTKIQ
ncbi:alanine/glycine:cation symporter family protein [Lentibacillus sp. N15]|uniref:alanine/glycine:cation symporter family protein n=1 Tax=Lentibacillus songyuanensis TaxID=3136161 RepID=UPI0031BB7B0B